MVLRKASAGVLLLFVLVQVLIQPRVPFDSEQDIDGGDQEKKETTFVWPRLESNELPAGKCIVNMPFYAGAPRASGPLLLDIPPGG
jgi:hypothetical protein